METEKQIALWMENTPEDPALAGELRQLAAAGDTGALQSRFAGALRFGTGGLLTIRPSGTEPKLKMYCAVKNADKQTAQKQLDVLCAHAGQMFDLI